MTNKVVHLNRIGTVTFSKNKRSKNIRISVKPDKTVRVSFPYFVSGDDVTTFLLKNEEWIKQQQLKFEAKKNKLTDGTEIKTKLHIVTLISGDENSSKIEGEKVILSVKDFNSDESIIFTENILTEIYRFEAKKILPPKLEELARQNGFHYNKINIRNNKRNWGSCSSKNNISLNLQMMKLPGELIDYILLHELVHTEIKNHGSDFWNKLNQITDNKAKELAKKVKQFSTYTL